MDEQVEGVFLLELAGSRDCEEPSRKELSFSRLVSEANLTPLHRRTQGSFSQVVGRLHSFIFEKGEQAVPVLQQALCGFTDIIVLTGPVVLETPVHPGANGNRFEDEGLPVQTLAFEGVPQGEHSACLGKHPFGELHAVRASTGVFDPFNGPYDVSPTELTDALMVCFVSGIHVRAKASMEHVSKDLSEDLGASGCGDVEKRKDGSGTDPYPSGFAVRFPAGFIDVEHGLCGQRLSDLFAWPLNAPGDFFMEVAHRS